MSQVKNSELQLTDNALKVLERRYLIKDKDGKVVETPSGLFRRVADHIASAEKKYGASEKQIKEWSDTFYEMMTSLEFLPNSPTLMNAGRELGQLSACFVLPIEDSMESIFETIKNTALIHKSGGGTGFSFSRLRPKNSIVKSTSGVASGPISFMKVFNSATEAVKQGGTRRGANMGILRVDHPDIKEFMTCKKDNKEITNFNISVAVTNEFMDKVKANEDFDLVDPKDGRVQETVKARELYDMMIEGAWQNGDPGIIFIDRVNEDNTTPELGQIEATNPCGEQPLLPYESCNLGSINLSLYVKEDGKVDYGRLGKTVKKAVRFLDNVIDVNKFPLPEIKEMVSNNRKIGLGAMGFADMLFKMGIAYNSEEGTNAAREVMGFIYDQAMEASAQLGEKRGTFPNYNKSIYKDKGPSLRNATVVTIAPTGTISMIADCSSGIEPLFSLVFTKTVMDGTDLYYVNKHFEAALKEKGLYSEEMMKRIAEAGTIQDINEIPEDIKKAFVVAADVTPYWHVKMQSAFQEYTDDAVSKTVNFPNKATREEVSEVYMLAYEMGCKGITIYRDGSRDEQVLNVGIKKDVEAAQKSDVKEADEAAAQPFRRKPRPEIIQGTTAKIGTGCGSLYVTINQDDAGKPFEMFSQMGKAGGCAASQLEAIGRLVSLALRANIPLDAVMEQLRGIRCPEPTWLKGMRIFSCADAIARVIEKRLNEEGLPVPKDTEKHSPHTMHEEQQTASVEVTKSKANVIGVCPDCGAAVWHEEGCAVCHACGYSKCS